MYYCVTMYFHLSVHLKHLGHFGVNQLRSGNLRDSNICQVKPQQNHSISCQCLYLDTLFIIYTPHQQSLSVPEGSFPSYLHLSYHIIVCHNSHLSLFKTTAIDRLTIIHPSLYAIHWLIAIVTGKLPSGTDKDC